MNVLAVFFVQALADVILNGPTSIVNLAKVFKLLKL